MHDPAVGCLRSISSENAATARQRAICGNFRRQKWIPWRFLGLEKWWPAIFCTISDPPSRTLPHHTVAHMPSPTVRRSIVHQTPAVCKIDTLSFRLLTDADFPHRMTEDTVRNGIDRPIARNARINKISVAGTASRPAAL